MRDEEGEPGVLLVVLVELVLDFHRALEGLDRVLEIDEEGVAYRLDDRAVVSFDDARDEIVVVFESSRVPASSLSIMREKPAISVYIMAASR